MKVEILKSGKRVYFKLLEGVWINNVYIPEDFNTDFASVPRSLWNILPPMGKHNEAALLHDYLYVNNIGTRKQADKDFLNVMLESGVKKTTAYMMYWGVRLGGGKWWNKKGKVRIFEI